MLPRRCASRCVLVDWIIVFFFLLVHSLDAFSVSHPPASTHSAAPAVIPDPLSPAYPQQPPHSGCHFLPVHPGTPTNHQGPRQSKRFFEGWYYRITLPDTNASFAFIFSIEDPFLEPSQLSLSCHQIMGPDDDYLVQADRDPTKFWAWRHQQGLGCVFQYNNHDNNDASTADLRTVTAMDPDEFTSRVESGFQMLPTRLQGKLIGHDGSRGGVFDGQGVAGQCTYDMEITPIAGWGDEDLGQKSTAGWLASYKVFEPHWQVTMADGRATGSVTWKGKVYNFVNAPFYAEKNWGGAFPIKWYWCQCNSFEGYMAPGGPTLSVTAGGGTRKIPLGQKESLGMVSVHYNGKFYEATPWLGTMQWNISTWGYWKMTGRSTKGARPFEVQLEAICESPGVKLRAPTEKEGMQYFCRDSFHGNVKLSLWELERDPVTNEYVRGALLINNATSSQAAVEVGGGPWWDSWIDVSVMKQPMRGLVRVPYRIANLKNRLMTKVTRVKETLFIGK